MLHKVVARFKNGMVLRGSTTDFAPNRPTFTLSILRSSGISEDTEVVLEDLKALFFVKTLEGTKEYRERKMRAPDSQFGKRLLVTFADGESLRGTTLGVNLCQTGFLLFPSDTKSNNNRIFVIRSAIKEMRQED